MSETKQRIVGSEAPDAEVELSTEDLLGLSGSCDNNKRAPEPLERAIAAVAVSSASAMQKRVAPTSARRPMSPASVAASLTIAVGIIGTLYFAMTSKDDALPSMAQQRVLESQFPTSAPQVEGKPVLFANPFDAKEVFEFPAGTSEAEARDAVAEILMERAMERQRHFDARVSSNR